MLNREAFPACPKCEAKCNPKSVKCWRCGCRLVVRDQTKRPPSGIARWATPANNPNVPWWQFWKGKSAPLEARPANKKIASATDPLDTPKASRVYVYSTVVMDSAERQEAVWGGFFTMHTEVDRGVAKDVQWVGAITSVEPKWRKGGPQLNMEHATKLSTKVLDGLFDREHKGGCYLDAILLYPEKPTVFVVMVWNAPLVSSVQQRIHGVHLGK